MHERPTLFIGSSSEAKELARLVQRELEEDVECTIWDQGIFSPSESTLEALAREADAFDFALMIVVPNDMAQTRGQTRAVPRDNVMFELGLFIGRLGRDRTFFLYSRDKPPSLPSDLAGVTALTFGERADGRLRAALGPPCQTIREALRKLGARRPAQAAPTVVQTASSMQSAPTDAGVYAAGHTLSAALERCIAGQNEYAALVQNLDDDHGLDESSLFIGLLHVPPGQCREVHEYLISEATFVESVMEEVYDVFGPYDILVKLRAPNAPAEAVRAELHGLLRLRGYMGPKLSDGSYKLEPTFVDVTREFCGVQPMGVPLTRHGRGIVAFFHIKHLENASEVKRAFEKCRLARQYGPASILTGAYLGHKELVAQFYLTCGGYYDLAKVVFSLEAQLQEISRAADRVTLLAMSEWERSVKPSDLEAKRPAPDAA